MRSVLPPTALAFAAACAPTAPDASSTSNGATAVPRPDGAASASRTDPLLGAWRIAAVNGRAPRSLSEAEGRTPKLIFSPGGYGGNSGCNSFGGLGLHIDGRYQGGPAMQSVMSCGPELNAQESTITGLLRASPRVHISGGDRVTLVAGTDRLELARQAEDRSTSAGKAEPPLLAGTSWSLGILDREPLPRAGEGRDARRLSFGADGWTARLACATLTGGWKQEGDRIVRTAPASREARACPPAEAALDARYMALMDASPRFATGANGEFLIASGDHLLYGARVREPTRDDSALLSGRWRVVALDGAAPLARAASPRPFVTFGPTGYFGSTGCNGFGGLSLAQGGRLYTVPGPQTQALCADSRAQEDRMTALFAAAPRIAAAGPEEIALVDRAGSLRLRRDGGRTAAQTGGRLWTGEVVRARLERLDGQLVRDPSAVLSLSPGRWAGRVGCQPQGGVWRRRNGAFAFFTDRPLAEPKCDEPAAARDRRFTRLLNGEARVLIGPNGEFLLAGEGGWLAGQITP